MKNILLLILAPILLMGFDLRLCAQDESYIRSIAFEGNTTLSKELLLKRMNTKPRTVTEKLTFWKKRTPYSSFTLDEDILRLKKYYQQNGFLNPIIKSKVVPRKKEMKLDIQILITEGIPVFVESVNYSIPNDDSTKVIMDSLIHQFPLKKGNRFRDEDVIAMANMIRVKFSSNGYPFINIEKEIELLTDNHSVAISFKIIPGKMSYFGEIQLFGDTLVSRKFIFRNIEIVKGEEFSQTRLEKAREKIFDLGLFRYVTLRVQMDSTLNDALPIVIQVKELPRYSFKAGAGYGTEDRFRLSILLTRLNFFGGGRTLIIKANRSYFVPINVEAKFIQPNIRGKKLNLILNPYFTREREESFQVDRLGSNLSLQKNFSRSTSAYVSYTLGLDKVDFSKGFGLKPDVIPAEQSNNKSGVTLGFSRNKTNDLFAPTRGWTIDATTTYMGLGFNSSFHYVKLQGKITFLQSLGQHLVFAGKVKAGVMDPIQGDMETPIEDRFLLGGAQSLRGWGRNQISPIDENGLKIGGNTMMEGSAELRFPLVSIFSGAAFIDAGDVLFAPWDFQFNNLNYNVGLGLRVKTPIGPIRLDLATPVTEKFRAQFFITIGNAF